MPEKNSLYDTKKLNKNARLASVRSIMKERRVCHLLRDVVRENGRSFPEIVQCHRVAVNVDLGEIQASEQVAVHVVVADDVIFVGRVHHQFVWGVGQEIASRKFIEFKAFVKY